MAVQTVGGYPVAQNYIPQLYARTMLEKFYDNTIMKALCNKDYEGELKKFGDKIIIRQRPNVPVEKYVIGQGISYPALSAQSVEFIIQRARHWAFQVNDVHRAQTDLKGFLNEWTNDALMNAGIVIETEFFADVVTKCSPLNQGLTAGRRSGAYNLGAVGTPLEIVGPKTTLGANQSYAPDLIAAMGATLQEQPGGIGTNPYVVIPVNMSYKLQTSELKAAFLTGDSTSLLRKEVTALGTIAGFTVYTSNLLPFDDLGSGKKAFYCLFGDTSAITFAEQFEKMEMLKNPSDFGDLLRSLLVYDWFPIQPTRYGTAYVTIDN